MYGCRRSPNRKLNHTNLICGRGNQITCFGCSADDEFIFVTKLSQQRKGGGGDRVYMRVCVCVYCTGWWCKEVHRRFCHAPSPQVHYSSKKRFPLFPQRQHMWVAHAGRRRPVEEFGEKVSRSVRRLQYVLVSTAAEQLDICAWRPKLHMAEENAELLIKGSFLHVCLCVCFYPSTLEVRAVWSILWCVNVYSTTSDQHFSQKLENVFKY